MLPNKWGQGQLFAFSALDGDSLARLVAGIFGEDELMQIHITCPPRW